MLLELAPLLIVAVALVVATGRLLSQRGAWQATYILAASLVVRAAVNGIAALWFHDASFEFATRWWPMLDAATAVFAFAAALASHGHARRSQGIIRHHILPGLLGFLGGAIVIALALEPTLYWGRPGATGEGPLFFINGLKFVAYAAIGLVLLGPLEALSPTNETRRARLVLATLFLLDVAHWATADLLLVEAAGVRLDDVRTGADHYGRLVAVPLLVIAGLRIAFQAFVTVDPRRRRDARWAMVALLASTIGATLILVALAIGIFTPDNANTAIVLVLDALYTVPLALWIAWRPASVSAAFGPADAVQQKRLTSRLVFNDAASGRTDPAPAS